MTVEKINVTDSADASVERGGTFGSKVDPHGYYTFECVGPDGGLKWKDEIHNIVATVGKNALLDVFFGTGVQGAGKTTWFMGLANSSPTVAAGDTMSSHSGWAEKTEVKQPALLFLFRLTPLLQLAVLSLQITQRKVELRERCTRLVLSQLVIRLLPVVIRST